MEKIIVKVSWSGDNYVAGTDKVNGTVFVTNKDFEKLISEFEKAFKFHVESSVEDGNVIPEQIKKCKFTFDYDLLTSALLHKLGSVVTLSAIHKATGINEKQLGHYKSGLKNPRPEQRKKIIEGKVFIISEKNYYQLCSYCLTTCYATKKPCEFRALLFN